MNSYERRIIHTALADHDKVITESYGNEPNRCIVVKLKNNISKSRNNENIEDYFEDDTIKEAEISNSNQENRTDDN